MTDIECLANYRTCRYEASVLAELTQRLRARIESNTGKTPDGLPGSKAAKNTFESQMVRLLDLEQMLRERQYGLDYEMERVYQIIDRFTGLRRQILVAHYIQGMPLKEFAKAAGYSEKHIWNTHEEIIQKVREQ